MGFDDLTRLAGSRLYARSIVDARRRFLRGETATVAEIRKVYRQTAETIRLEIEHLTPGTLQRSHLQALASRLERRAQELNAQVLAAARQGIYISAEAGVSASQNVAAELLKEGWPKTEVARLFAPVNERAVLAVLTRTQRDGLKLSDRIWRVGERMRNSVTRIVEDGVARGLDSRKMARQVQQYLQPGQWTQMKLETRRSLGVSKDVSYEAMRLARTEMNNAFHEGAILANQENPAYRGVYWRLSSNHPVADICDDMARHGGDGFYPKGEEPMRPHPQCRCLILPAYEEPVEFADRLATWIKDPQSQPDIEGWYDDARKTLQRPKATRSDESERTRRTA
ncbi:MAG: hypothetical protein WD024_06870 [Bacillota bacterium]